MLKWQRDEKCNILVLIFNDCDSLKVIHHLVPRPLGRASPLDRPRARVDARPLDELPRAAGSRD